MQQEKKKQKVRHILQALHFDKPKSVYFIYGGVALLAVLLYAGGMRLQKETKDSKESTVVNYTEKERGDELEQRLALLLSQIRGAGKVAVLITYDTGPEIVPAMSTNSDENIRDAITGGESNTQRSIHTVTEPATVQGSGTQMPIILVEKQPTIRGVVIVAQGAADISVRLQLQRAVRAVTGIEEDRIEVFEMAGGNDI